MSVAAVMRAGMPEAHPERALALALQLAHTEDALQRLGHGQIDAVLDAQGHVYLLRPVQEHLRRNEAWWQALFDTVPDVITVLNGEGEVRYQSPAVARVLGHEAGALVGRRMLEYVHPEEAAGFERAYGESLRRVRPVTSMRFRHRAGDGSWREVDATMSYLELLESSGVVLSFRDMGRHEAEEAERREEGGALSAATKDRFLAMLSHELRTPLMPVLFGITTLQQDARFVEARSTLVMMRRNVEMQLQLLEELIDFSTVGEHKVRLRSEEVDAHEAIGFVREICQMDAAAARVEVVMELGAERCMVLADGARLQQVMWNLLKNAIKFSKAGGRVWIVSSNEEAGDVLKVEFIDHGAGIEEELLPLIFDPFQQGSMEAQRLHGGLGLGLFIAKGLAEAQHGTLSVASEGVGRGARFVLSFPTTRVETE